MKHFFAHIAFVFIFILLSAWSISSAQNILPDLNSILRSIQQQYAPDQRLAVFNVSYGHTRSGFVLRGEVDNLDAKHAVLLAFKKRLKRDILDSIYVLPEIGIGNNANGIVIFDVVNVYGGPGKQNELVTQALMGTVVKLLKSSNGYLYIQMPDKYLGWIDMESVFVTDRSGIKDWEASPKVIVTSSSGIVNHKPDFLSAKLSDIVEGCILKYRSSQNGWISVELADGRRGFVKDTLIHDYDEWKKSRILSSGNLEKTAKSFLGITYLWGGISTRGMDCSGFVKTVYNLNGMDLKRDANQQALQGTHIDPGKDFQNLKKGDLLFFGRKASAKKAENISHVAMYLENGLFIHSSKNVHYGSFDPLSKYYDAALMKKFVRARRMFDE
jgi:hypothetical protein